MEKAELLKAIGALDGGADLKKAADKLFKELEKGDVSSELETYKKEVESLKATNAELNGQVESLSKDLETAGGERSKATEDYEKRIAALEEKNAMDAAEKERLLAEKAESELSGFFVDGLTESFGADKAKDKVAALLYQKRISRTDEGGFAYGEKTGDDAIAAIITDNPSWVNGNSGTDTNPRSGGGMNDDQFAALEAQMLRD